MQYAAGYRAKLAVFTVLVKSDQLVLRDCDPFRRYDQELDWGRQPISAGRAVNMTVYISFHDSDGSDTLSDTSGFPVHHFGKYLDPLVFLPGVHADFGW